MIRLPRVLFPMVLVASFAASAAIRAEITGAPASLVIEAGAPIAKISPMHHGLMTEEINYSCGGGLYARTRAQSSVP